MKLTESTIFNMKFILSTSVLVLLFCSCKKDKDKVEFDRGAMLVNISSNIILPALTEMEESLDQLELSVNSFNSNVSQVTLDAAKAQFVEAYKTYQRCKMYDFGPMADYGITAGMNTYPTDTGKISSNISSGSYNLSSADNITAIGLPAMDYLLYDGSDTEILNLFSSHSNANNRKNYLSAVCQKMNSEFSVMTGQWQSYKATFDAADGNDIGGSSSILFNAFVKDIELLKNAKIGIPAGFQTSGQTLPNYVEALYSVQSIELAIENTKALQNLFVGGTGISFDDYIRDVESDDIKISLADNINNQFEIIETKLSSVGTPLSDKVNSNQTAVSDAWNEIKKLVTYSKTDMSSILGLLITFQDNDGD